jgi:hypothetical protein
MIGRDPPSTTVLSPTMVTPAKLRAPGRLTKPQPALRPPKHWDQTQSAYLCCAGGESGRSRPTPRALPLWGARARLGAPFLLHCGVEVAFGARVEFSQGPESVLDTVVNQQLRLVRFRVQIGVERPRLEVQFGDVA